MRTLATALALATLTACGTAATPRAPSATSSVAPITVTPYAAAESNVNAYVVSDGQGAIRQLERIALGWRLKPVAPPVLVITHAQAPADILRAKFIEPADQQRCEELGGTLAAGLGLGLF